MIVVNFNVFESGVDVWDLKSSIKMSNFIIKRAKNIKLRK